MYFLRRESHSLGDILSGVPGWFLLHPILGLEAILPWFSNRKSSAPHPSSRPCHLSPAWQPHLAAAAKSLQSCPTLCDPIDGSPPGSPNPGILQARNGVCCHFLLQSMKVKSESEVSQSCPTPSDLTDCILPGSSIHGIFQARVLEWYFGHLI